jgi:hypothetical protein
LNEKEGHEQSTDNGPDAFEDIDFSNGGGIFSDVLGIELTPISKKGTLGNRDREENQERGVKDCGEAKPLSRSGKKDIFEYSGEVDGERKGHGKRKLEQNKNLYLSFYLFYRFTNHEGTDCTQDEPVGENDSKSEFIAEKRDEKLPQQDDLRDDTAHSLNEQRAFKGSDVYHEVLSSEL